MKNHIIPFYKQVDKLIVKGKGCYLYDAENKEYIDFESGDWAANIGHSNERISAIIKTQAQILIHDGLRFRNQQSEDLSTQLLKKLNIEEGKSVFLNSGSEAVNLGITIARNLTKRNGVLKVDGTFLSSYGHGQISANNTHLLNVSFNNIESLSGIDFSDIAVFVFEPGNSHGLIKCPSVDFISSIANEIKRNGGLLMANEVTTGFGRTGKWFGFQHYDYKPDIVSVGKALGNGYPISCVSINRKVSDLFDKEPFRYAQSHQNDPLGCAVGLEVINIIDDNDLVQGSCDMGIYFLQSLKQLQERHTDKIIDIRARGLMLALELHPYPHYQIGICELAVKG